MSPPDDAASSLATPIVVLAAGASTRMGQPKGTLDYHGRPWLAAQLEALPTAEVVVVLGHHADAYREILADRGVTLAVNEDPDRGSFSSLQVGLEAAGGGAAFVLPLDVPCPGASVWIALEATEASAIPVLLGKGGHPVRLSARLVEQLRGLDPAEDTSRLDEQMRSDAARRVPVDDPRATMNLNTPDAWTRFVAGEVE